MLGPCAPLLGAHSAQRFPLQALTALGFHLPFSPPSQPPPDLDPPQGKTSSLQRVRKKRTPRSWAEDGAPGPGLLGPGPGRSGFGRAQPWGSSCPCLAHSWPEGAQPSPVWLTWAVAPPPRAPLQVLAPFHGGGGDRTTIPSEGWAWAKTPPTGPPASRGTPTCVMGSG